MPDDSLSLPLTILRLVRGWNQDELARATNVANSSISEYERGRKVPELATLRRLLGAMGYPLGAIDATQRFVATLRLGAALSSFEVVASSGGPPEGLPGQDALMSGGDPGADLRFELEEAAAETGRAVHRAARLLLLFIARDEVATTRSRQTSGG